MKFTRDLCRLLGLGGGGPGEEQMEAQNGSCDPSVRGRDQNSSQTMLNNEEGLDDEEKIRRRAERRRAKKKRQKERKKLERKERMEDTSEQEEEAAGVLSDSDSEEEMRGEEQWTAVHPRAKCSPESVSTLVMTESKRNRQLSHRMSDEEPEWDISSAFVANAANNIKLKGLMNRAMQISRENKENEAGSSQEENTEEMRRMGESLTLQGIEMFEKAQYRKAVDMFTEAIFCDPKDHRLYGNRSYCYWFLEQFSSALADARRSICLAPDWPKGYFRKGCALVGLKRYGEAEKALEQVLKLDQNCKEASKKLFNCRVLQLMEMGLDEEQSKQLLEKFTTVQAAVNSSDAKTLKLFSQQDSSGNCRSLWVGNITQEVTEKDLCDLFKINNFGEIESIKVLHERFCAFVNFKNGNVAAKALEKLQGVEFGGNKLVMRYPDRWMQRTMPSVQRNNTSFSSNTAGSQSSSAAIRSRWRTPLNGDECFYWRTTGCFYGDKCRFKHIPDQQGRDKRP
ncbi:hsp70-Hsp90 organizing protein 3-like isoform X2 [Archocentrus centrarchus]|uniref:hsp70-Hsp90 organizing protein 3-like isoform X2 n=1 Tax=Archocentrus centrarchus TaxID=63155 RepID=UPI0011E9BBD0|nr:hsp70-Hsp90 organizing protein 3-like isoform X2 [Archocentrus centrarchus]